MIISDNSPKRKLKNRLISFTQTMENLLPREKWRSVLNKFSQQDCDLVMAGTFSAAHSYMYYCSSTSTDKALVGRVFKQ